MTCTITTGTGRGTGAGAGTAMSFFGLACVIPNERSPLVRNVGERILEWCVFHRFPNRIAVPFLIRFVPVDRFTMFGHPRVDVVENGFHE